jgi:hypothetical protein
MLRRVTPTLLPHLDVGGDNAVSLSAPPGFDTKIAIILDEQLAGWLQANVTAFFKVLDRLRP